MLAAAGRTHPPSRRVAGWRRRSGTLCLTAGCREQEAPAERQRTSARSAALWEKATAVNPPERGQVAGGNGRVAGGAARFHLLVLSGAQG